MFGIKRLHLRNIFLATLWGGLAFGLEFGVIELLLLGFLTWGFSNRHLVLEIEVIKRNYYRDIQPHLEWLGITIPVLVCLMWYSLLHCSRHQFQFLDVISFAFIIGFGIVWASLPTIVFNFFKTIFSVRFVHRPPSLAMIPLDAGIEKRFLSVPLPPPRRTLALRED